MSSPTHRFCTNCMNQQPIGKGGRWKTFNNGLHRRWMCDGCVARVQARRKEKKSVTANQPV